MGYGYEFKETYIITMKNKIAIISIIIISAFLYTLTLHGVWGNPGPSAIVNQLDKPTKPFELSPERGRYAHIYALAEDNTYTLSQAWATIVYPDVGVHNGTFYSFFAPGISYMAVPFYKLGRNIGLGQVFAFSLIPLFSIAALICIYKIGRNSMKLPIWAALFSAFVFGFASSAWGYAVTLYQHHITTFLILFAFYAVWKFKHNKSLSWMWAIIVGLSYALAVFIDYPNALLFMPVIVYFIIALFSVSKEKFGYKVSVRWVGVLALIAFFALTSLHFYHNAVYYGSWKTLSGALPSYHIQSATSTATTIDSVVVKPNALEIAKNTPTEKNVVAFFSEEHVPSGFFTLMFSADRGLFFFCPIFILGFIGMYLARKKTSPEYYTLLALVAVNILLYSSWGDPWGGWAFGPRYLIPSMAILALFTGVFVSSKPLQLIKRTLAFALALFGSFIGLLGVLTTNAIPPLTEGILLPAKKYNYLLNLEFLKKNQSSSFIFNSYYLNHLTLKSYLIMIYSALVVIMVVLLFILPIFSSEKSYE